MTIKIKKKQQSQPSDERTAEKAQEGIERDSASGVYSAAISAARAFLSVAVGAALVSFVTLGFIPSVGIMLLNMTGITETSTVASVLALWLVPEMFIAACACYATIALIRWFWAKSGEWARNLTTRYNAKRTKKRVGGAKKKRRPRSRRKAEASSDSTQDVGDSDFD